MADGRTQLNTAAAAASVAVAATLVVAKLWALGVTGALSVAASLADSALDLMVSLGGLAAIRYAQRPPDAEHTFGHSSAEDLAALGQSAFILVSAVSIAVAALIRLGGGGAPIAAEGAGIAVMVLSIVLTTALVVYQSRTLRRTGNRVIRADRLHYLGDLVPNLGAIAALWASARFGLTSLDAIVALGAAAMLAVGAIRIGRGAWDALMDRAAPDAMVEDIRRVAAGWPGLHGFHDLQTRTAGDRVFVNLHVEIDGDMPLKEAHDIGAGLRHEIMRRHPRTEVIIHKDPVRDAAAAPRRRPGLSGR